MAALERFESIVAGPNPDPAAALAAIAAHGRPGVDDVALLGRLDELAARGPAPDAATLCAALFGAGGLRGDADDYYSPDNSLLDRMLERRLGIPITLSIVGIDVGRRVGVDLVGIGMPGHFLLRDAHDPDAFFDPFRGGAPMDRTACRAVFERLHGTGATFDESLLAPTPPIAIVARVLANLHNAYVRRSDRAGVVRVLELQERLPGSTVTTRRTLADVLAAAGRFDEAARVHDALAASDPDPSHDHATAALRLRARMN